MTLPSGDPVALGHPLIPLARDWAVAILRTIEAGWVLSVEYPNMNAAAHEIAITTQLRDGMVQAAESGKFWWKGKMFVLPGTESRSRPDISQPDGLTDISIFVIEIAVRYGVHDPQAVIECKRVSGESARLCREYVENGINRFRDGKYGRCHSIGFMIGYLISEDARAAVDRINNYLNRSSRHVENLERSNIVNESWAWQSEHPREENKTIELQHAFLAFP